jgi:hypothetical protein
VGREGQGAEVNKLQRETLEFLRSRYPWWTRPAEFCRHAGPFAALVRRGLANSKDYKGKTLYRAVVVEPKPSVLEALECAAEALHRVDETGDLVHLSEWKVLKTLSEVWGREDLR